MTDDEHLPQVDPHIKDEAKVEIDKVVWQIEVSNLTSIYVRSAIKLNLYVIGWKHANKTNIKNRRRIDKHCQSIFSKKR